MHLSFIAAMMKTSNLEMKSECCEEVEQRCDHTDNYEDWLFFVHLRSQQKRPEKVISSYQIAISILLF